MIGFWRHFKLSDARSVGITVGRLDRGGQVWPGESGHQGHPLQDPEPTAAHDEGGAQPE